MEPKLQRYYRIVEDKQRSIDPITEQLQEIRENIAELIINQTKTYNKDTRTKVTAINETEDELNNKYYILHEELSVNRRKFRQRLVTLLRDENFETSVKPERGSFIRDSVELKTILGDAKVSQPKWNSLLFKRDNIIKFDVLLGQGAFGRVFKGQVFGTAVAIKELTIGGGGVGSSLTSTGGTLGTSPSASTSISSSNILWDSVRLQNFEKEIRLLSEINHENILKFMGACLDNNYYCLLTEVAENGSLYDVLYPRSGVTPVKLSFQKKMNIIKEIVEGMFHLHTHIPQILHLDLKSSNILLDADWHVRIADFGMSKINLKDFYSTASSYVGGTPLYMAPELFQEFKRERMGPEVDVYSFGVLVNELLTGRVPYSDPEFGGVKTFEELKKIVTGGEEDKKYRPGLVDHPKVLRSMVTSCWAQVPLQRPTFTDLRNDCPWEQALKGNANDDALGRDLLEKFSSEKIVTFHLFIKHLKQTYSIPGLLTDEKDVSVRSLKALLGVGKHTEALSHEKVEQFTWWFAGVKKKEFIYTLDAICSKQWFFGTIDDKQVSEKLANQHSGTYLVRWSDNNKFFVLHYIHKEKRDKKTIRGVNLHTTSILKLSEKMIEMLKDSSLNLKSPAPLRPPAFEGLGLETTKFFTAAGESLYAVKTFVGTEDYTGPVNYIL